jgi:hypothetical protein
MARISYSLDGVKFGAELVAYGTLAADMTVSLGFVENVELNISDEVRQMRHIKGGASGFLVDRNVDLLHTVQGSLSTNPIDFKSLQYFLGSYTATTSYAIATNRTVKSLSLQGNYDGTDALQVVGLVFSKSTLNLRENEPVQINYDFIAKKESKITSTITGTAPTQDPLTFLSGSITVDGKNYKINTMTLDMDWSAIGRRNIEAVDSGDERVITEVIKRNFGASFSINADLQDASNEYEVYTDGAVVQTAREDFTIVVTMVDAVDKTHTITVTGARGTQFRKSYRTDGEVKNFDINGVAIDVAVAGTV